MPDPVQYWIVEDDIMPGLKKDIKLNKASFLILNTQQMEKPID